MNGPIDEGNVSLKSTIALIVAAFAIGGWMVALQMESARNAEAIAEMKPTLDAICERLACTKEGMRK